MAPAGRFRGGAVPPADSARTLRAGPGRSGGGPVEAVCFWTPFSVSLGPDSLIPPAVQAVAIFFSSPSLSACPYFLYFSRSALQPVTVFSVLHLSLYGVRSLLFKIPPPCIVAQRVFYSLCLASSHYFLGPLSLPCNPSLLFSFTILLCLAPCRYFSFPPYHSCRPLLFFNSLFLSGSLSLFINSSLSALYFVWFLAFSPCPYSFFLSVVLPIPGFFLYLHSAPRPSLSVSVLLPLSLPAASFPLVLLLFCPSLSGSLSFTVSFPSSSFLVAASVLPPTSQCPALCASFLAASTSAQQPVAPGDSWPTVCSLLN